MTDYAAIIAAVEPAAWWSEHRLRNEINAVRPPETRAEFGASIAWDDAVRAAVTAWRLSSAPPPPPVETMELDLTGGNYD
jgi:hypothetical protein